MPPQNQPEFVKQESSVKNRVSIQELNKQPLVYQSINGLGTFSDDENDEDQRQNQLLCTQRELAPQVEEEIKDGFFELK